MTEIPHTRSPASLSILIVDDNKFTRDLLRRILVSFGMPEVAQADSAEDALRQMTASYFDLVICDIVMGGISGIQFVKTLRSRPHQNSTASHVPIIMLTAHADEALVVAAMKAGANGYLVKPLVPARLMALIAKLCHCATPTLRSHAPAA